MSAPAKVAGADMDSRRAVIVQALRDYAEVHGPDFTTAAFNPSVARWRDREELVEVYYRGNPLRGGEAWPSLNTIRQAFGGSFNAARVAAGLEANRPGPSSGKRGGGRPVRDVRVQRVEVRERSTKAPSGPPRQVVAPEDKRKVADLRAAIKRLEREVARAEAREAKGAERLHKARADLRAAQDQARARGVELAQTTVQTEALDAARVRAESAEREARVLRSRLEDVELTVKSTREELERVRAELAVVAEVQELADPAELERAAAEVRDARRRVAVAREAQAAAEARADEAVRAKQAAERAARVAEADRSRESAARVEIQRAVAGHDRPLSAAEVAELREKGPAGQAVFAAAVKAVAKAAAKGQRAPLKRALLDAAAAAVRWGDRL